MNIKMKSLAIGPDCRFEPGKKYEVGDDVGRRFVDGGYAVDITPMTPAEKIASNPESAKVAAKKAKVADENEADAPDKTPKAQRGRRRG